MSTLESANAEPRPWLPELASLFGLMLVTTLVFWNTNLDIYISGLFYHPANPVTPWDVGLQPLWQFFYEGASIFTGLLIVGSITLLIFIRKRTQQQQRFRLYASYMLLLVLIGPGLLINGVFKGYWDRPRPSEIQQLGGTETYLPPLMIGHSKMFKSFPSGHATAGFAYLGFFFILRRRHKALARIALVLAIFFGLLMGAGRIVAGGHFLSDVLWAGYLTFLAASVLYHFVLRVPLREQRIDQPDSRSMPRLGWLRSVGYSIVLLAMIVAALFASPFDATLAQQIMATPRATLPSLDYQLDRGDVILQIDNQSKDLVSIQGTADGFGLPTNALIGSLQDKGDHIAGEIRHTGTYTELITHYNLVVRLDQLRSINIQIENGSIRVASKLTPLEKAKLTLHVNVGKINWAE